MTRQRKRMQRTAHTGAAPPRDALIMALYSSL